MELFTPTHVIFLFILLIAIAVFLVPLVFYILTVRRLLNKCAPQSRTMEPNMAWLLLVPVVNLVINFIVVLGIAKSLRNEFNLRGLYVEDPTPGQSIGLAMAICVCGSIIPFVGALAGLAYLVLWIIYWIKIAEYSRLLDTPPQVAPPVSAI